MIEKHSIDLENYVLQSLMELSYASNIKAQKAMLELNSDCFYDYSNKEIFNLIKNCFYKKESFGFVDILLLIPSSHPSLQEKMQWLIDEFRSSHTGTASFYHHVERLVILMQLRKQSKLLNDMTSLVNACKNPEDAQETLSRYLGDVSDLTFCTEKSGLKNSEWLELLHEGKIKESFAVPTTCEKLNALNDGGIMPKSFVTIAAGAGVGKTGFSIYLMDAIARTQPDKQTLFFSLEMETSQIFKRHLGICGGKQVKYMGDKEFMEASLKMNDLDFTCFDASTNRRVMDIDFIITTSRLRAVEKPISVIVVDYLGLVESSGSFERNDLRQTDITNKLARLAIELDCVVLGLSQINRSSSERSKDDRCPYPSDASGSSGSYFSSTLWLGIDRPELYHEDPCYKNQFVVKCRKNRFGDNWEIIFAFNEGTFAEVPNGHFHATIKEKRSPMQKIIGGCIG